MPVQAAEGVNFMDGVSKEDFKIVVESTSSCVIEDLTSNQIDCRPPVHAPTPDLRFSYNELSVLDCHRDNSLYVQVGLTIETNFYRLDYH